MSMLASSEIKSTQFKDRLIGSRERYLNFIDSCQTKGGFSLTQGSDTSAYALCFAIFGYHLLGRHDRIEIYRKFWDELLRSNLKVIRSKYISQGPLNLSKPYLQLLSFTLSALSILGTLTVDPLEALILEVLPRDIKSLLYQLKVHDGVARTGNQAMFSAILLLHARDYLNLKVDSLINDWTDFHLGHLNAQGFWGNCRAMTHLQFQNGYHQYEILDYLDIHDVDWVRAARSVATLSDPNGHFAPYPGGGGCFDYDAVFILTGHPDTKPFSEPLLVKTAQSILSEQNPNGGFCESLKVRPLTLLNLIGMLRHIIKADGAARIERARYFISLIRSKNKRIHTHWSLYSRMWNESDLWDSWFRMLTVARIDSFLFPETACRWGFISYPGVGFHSSVRDV